MRDYSIARFSFNSVQGSVQLKVVWNYKYFRHDQKQDQSIAAISKNKAQTVRYIPSL